MPILNEASIPRPILGKTLPDLLDEACKSRPNKQAFNQAKKQQKSKQKTGKRNYEAWSNQFFQTSAKTLGYGLDGLGLTKGDRVAFLMHSDLNFALADMACALFGWVSVPISLTETLANIAFILKHSEARLLLVSNLDLLYQIVPQLWELNHLQFIAVVDVPSNWHQTRQKMLQCDVPRLLTSTKEDNKQVSSLKKRSEKKPETTCLCMPLFGADSATERSCPPFPRCIRLLSLAELREQGKAQRPASSTEPLQRPVLSPQDLATIIYTPVDSGELKGVMLTHENLSANALTAFRDSKIRFGKKERALSFLPLTHVFARVLFYGHLYYGHSLYFSSPSRVMKQLKVVKPTIFATVPLLLEKTYEKLLQLSEPQISPLQTTPQSATSPHRFFRRHFYRLQQRLLPQGGSEAISWRLLAWGLHLAQRYNPRHPAKPWGLYRLQLRLADWLVFRRWRSQFGSKLNCLICGGAPLRPEVARVFSAAGFPLLQGYGLSQTSSVVTYSRGDHIRSDTVGRPAAGAEIALATDGEVLVRGPYVMKGYFRDEAATQAAIDAEGWFHTGDRGQFDKDGFLTITGSKKSLFKLATGKYVAPEALEQAVMRSPLVAHAVAVGRGQKFCGLLVFPAFDALRPPLQALGSAQPIAQLLQHPDILQRYQAWIDEVNHLFPKWSTVKRFQVVNATFPMEMSRDAIAQIFATEIESLYQNPGVMGSRHAVQAVVPQTLQVLWPQVIQTPHSLSIPSPLFPMPPS